MSRYYYLEIRSLEFGVMWIYSMLTLTEEIMDTITAQPLCLLIHSFMKANQKSEWMLIQLKRPSNSMPTNATYLSQLDTITNHTCIDPDIINYNNHKEDKSPVPSTTWDQRI